MPLIRRPGAKIWYDVLGSGTPLLVLQGLGFPSDTSWRILPHLATRHTVILLDNRGVGRSEVPDGSFSIEDLADDAAVVLDHVGLGPAHVIGFSMGGLIAQELALEHPACVRSLLLGCTSTGGPDAVLMPPEVAKRFMDFGDPASRLAATRAAPVGYAPSTPAEEIDADLDVRFARPTSREGYGRQLRAVAEFDGTAHRLGALTCPVLILHGSADLIVPVANADRLKSALPHAEIKLFPGAAHILTTDATGPLVSAVVDFTEKQDAALPWSMS